MDNVENIVAEQDVAAEAVDQGGAEVQEQQAENSSPNYLVEATGGRVKTPEELNAIFAKADQADQWKTQLEAAKQVKQVSFADPIVEEINKLYGAGATQSEISAFFNVQSLDVESLDAVQAVKEQFKLQYPDLTREEINALVADEYGDEEESFSSLSPVGKAKLSKAASDAKNFLREKKVDVRQPASVKEQMRQTQELEATQNQWKSSVDQFVSSYDKVSLNAATKEGESNLFDYSVPKDNEGAIKDVVVNYMMNSGIDPNSQEAAPQVQDLVDRMVFFFHGKDIINNVVRHVSAQTAEQIQAAESGIIPSGRNVVPPQTGAGRGGKLRTFEEIKKDRLGF